MMRTLLRGLGLALLPLLLLGGCATHYVLDNNVQSFSSLPAVPAGATYRFERLPSQQGAAYQAQFEEMAGAALQRAGLRRDDATARYSVQIGAGVQTVLSPWADPWGPWGAGWGIHAFPHRRLGIGFMGGLRPEPPWYQREVRVIVRELASHKVVFESKAVNDGPWLEPAAVWPAMFQAALDGFPNAPPGPRRVQLQLGAAGAVPVRPVPATEIPVTPSPAGIPIGPPPPPR